MKGAQGTDVGCTLRAPHPNAPSQSSTPPLHPRVIADGGEGTPSPKTLDDLLAELPEGMSAGLSRKWLADQLTKDGYDLVRRVALHWYEKRNLGGLRSPGHFFQQEYAETLKRVLAEIEQERIENDPVLKAEREARIRKMEDEHQPMWVTLPDREEEPPVDDLEDLLK